MKVRYDLQLKTRFVLWVLKLFRPSSHTLTLDQIKKLRKPFPIDSIANWIMGKPPATFKVIDRTIPVRDGNIIPVRIYSPKDEKNLPIILNYHGGGWVLGNLQQSDNFCRELANSVGAIVISVDYRLAPEHKFPIAAHDAYDALLWAHENAEEIGGDPTRIGVTGDSAGGNLATAVCLQARDLNGPEIRYQALIYPACNGTFDYPSFKIHVEAPVLGQKDMYFFRNAYEAEPGDHLQPLFSPFLANDLSNLPPALVITAEYDPLLDDGKQYAQKLRDSGTPSEWVNFEKEFHGFITFYNHSPKCKQARALIFEKFQNALS